MQTLIDLEAATVFAVPLRAGGVHEGMVLEGPQGWGEFSPPRACPDHQLGRWLTAATEVGTVGWPDAVRGRIPVAVTITAPDPRDAHAVAAESGCRTAAVQVGVRSLGEDIARVEAVRDALGPGGAIRCDAAGRWDAQRAITAIAALDRVAGGLEFVGQPCADPADTAAVRRAGSVPIAVPAAPGSMTVDADIAVLHTGALGGARRALRIAEVSGLPCVVTAGVQTSIGASVAVALAGALPELRYACTVGTADLLAADVVGAGRALVATDGGLPVAPMSPAPAPELLQRFTVTDPDRIRWWRRRLQTAIAQ